MFFTSPESTLGRVPVPDGTRRARVLLATALLATLVLLLAHSAVYWFLTDDAFISFRYARNLRQGHGLVFNPGFERVEGYTNFLWVMVLAGLDRLGIEPARAALALSWVATAALWSVGLALAIRRAPARAGIWAGLVPALF